MKKICLLLVVALLLSGCGREPLPPETTATEDSAIPGETTEAATTEAVTVDHSYRGEDWESGYVITEDWGFFCPHMDTDVFPDLYVMGDFNNVILLSREPIDPETISVTLGTDLPYDVYVNEADWYFEYDKEVGYSAFSQFVYASYQNWDWKKHKEMNSRMPAADEEWKEAVAYDAEWMRMGEELETILETGEGMPEFYVYDITINVDYYAICGTDQTAVINYMDVSWPGVSFRHEFGELRIHGGFTDTFPEFPYAMEGIGFNQRMADNHGDYHYIGEQKSDLFGAFTASEEIALLRGYALDGSGEINDVRLVFQTDEGVVDMQWDENSKVWLDAGTVVEIWAKAGGPETFWSIRNERLYYCIEYECNGVRDVFMVTNHVIGNYNPFELWAIYFDETNMRECYEYYWWAD